MVQAPGLQTSFPFYLHIAVNTAALMQVGQALQNCLGNGGHHCGGEALQGEGSHLESGPPKAAAVRTSLHGTTWLPHLHAAAAGSSLQEATLRERGWARTGTLPGAVIQHSKLFAGNARKKPTVYDDRGRRVTAATSQKCRL